MFFTPELLAKRDSGFGLLWLAATSGSRSTFKRLPKRSVLTADISQLCDLISEPEEPLALRLSSNLMFGVVRVYKVKQEIFLTDVTNCVATLKKVVQEFHSTGAANGDFQMQNPTVRPSALTIVPDPKGSYELDYDAFVADWHDYLNLGVHVAEATVGSDPMFEDDDDDLDPNSNKKRRADACQKAVPQVEMVRKEAHTLEENHNHLLSASFDLSFTQEGAQAPGVSSSQPDVAFDNFLPFSDGLDFADGLGDDFARELGWGLSPAKSMQGSRTAEVRYARPQVEIDQAVDLDADFFIEDAVAPMNSPIGTGFPGTPIYTSGARRINARTAHKENVVPVSRAGSAVSNIQPSPAISFSRLFLSQNDDQPIQPFRGITTEEFNRQNQSETRTKNKRTRLLLDARTELTDDELKIARAKYLESQRRTKRELLGKKHEKDADRFLEELISGVPKGIQDEGLINFWQKNFKVQVEARSGILRIHEEVDEPATKRRKLSHDFAQNQNTEVKDYPDDHAHAGEEWGWTGEQSALPILQQAHDMDIAMAIYEAGDNRHSSEEPGQARRLSRSASILEEANLGFDIGARDSGNGSQRSSFFPWDNAGPSSSSGNIPLPEVDPGVDKVDMRLGSASSFSRRDSPIAGSHRESLQAIAISFSPVPGGRGSQVFGEDFAFEVEAVPEETQQETQRSETNLLSLERNSHNFLEYAKMQNQTLSERHGQLTLEHVVPKVTSTRHVAAAGFYHCLVLATKNLVRLEQGEPYGSVIIDII
ncbi:Rec8 like protein-domain-containing protein [Gymnopilus junonius]|uniref:Rec8 like protein-domain-containing protein n=1 Tax=Gymnopilus junonius TaxID=109634 RepID=A0A9P5NT92_GYMJU|nr:Rec8 like protein-domain-containing protein [Gymnopilus junonius]